MIEEALREIRDFMNEFEVHFTGTPRLYEHWSSPKDGNALIYALKAAAEFRHLQSTDAALLTGGFQNPYRDA